jgi:hypothetical protein
MGQYQFTESKNFKNLTPDQKLHFNLLLTDAMERGISHTDDPAFIEWAALYPGLKPWIAEYATVFLLAQYTTVFLLHVAYSIIWNFED